MTLTRVALFSLIVLMGLGTSLVVAGQGRQGAAPAAAAPPPPPAPQAGHPSGKLVIWGDMADFSRPGTPIRCYNTNRFKRGQRAGFRMTAVDGGTGEVENTTEMVAHIQYGGRTVDVPMRWRGNVPFPKQEYLRAPTEMWTGVWEVPMDAPIGALTYTVTAKDRFGRTASFTPFPSTLTQLAVVE
jgi:hypothetical protein